MTDEEFIELHPPMFKVGDKVEVYDTRPGKHHQFGFIDSMKNLIGNIYTIQSVIVCQNRYLKNESDGYKYLLAETNFSWASTMFKPVDNSIAVFNSCFKEIKNKISSLPTTKESVEILNSILQYLNNF